MPTPGFVSAGSLVVNSTPPASTPPNEAQTQNSAMQFQSEHSQSSAMNEAISSIEATTAAVERRKSPRKFNHAADNQESARPFKVPRKN